VRFVAHYISAHLPRVSLSGSESAVGSTRPLIQPVRATLFPRVNHSWSECGHSVPPTSGTPCALTLYLLSTGRTVLHIGRYFLSTYHILFRSVDLNGKFFSLNSAGLLSFDKMYKEVCLWSPSKLKWAHNKISELRKGRKGCSPTVC
jgi:hypothetical protein